MVISFGVGGVVGGPCDFSVSPSPFGLDFGILDFGLGLDNRSTGLSWPWFRSGHSGHPPGLHPLFGLGLPGAACHHCCSQISKL